MTAIDRWLDKFSPMNTFVPVNFLRNGTQVVMNQSSNIGISNHPLKVCFIIVDDVLWRHTTKDLFQIVKILVQCGSVHSCAGPFDIFSEPQGKFFTSIKKTSHPF